MTKFLKIGGKIVKNYFTIVGVITTGFVVTLVFDEEISRGARKVKSWLNGDASNGFGRGTESEEEDDDGWGAAEEECFEEDLDEETTEKAEDQNKPGQSSAADGKCEGAETEKSSEGSPQ